MKLIEKATIMHYHRHRIKACEAGSVGALGWRGTESQEKRFEVMSQVADFSGASVLDVGCGYGDLKPYLQKKHGDFTYIGIDQMPEFIDHAKTRFEGERKTYFYQTDFGIAELPEVDYVLASGALGYCCSEADFYTRMITKLYRASKKALVFNMLDAAHFPEDPLLKAHSIPEIMAYCRGLADHVELIQGYASDDFTVVMWRPVSTESRQGSQLATEERKT